MFLKAKVNRALRSRFADTVFVTAQATIVGMSFGAYWVQVSNVQVLVIAVLSAVVLARLVLESR